MVVHKVGDQRWEESGTAPGGDKQYRRTIGGKQSYDEMSKAELEAELESRGLAKSGNKDELVARLEGDGA